VKLLNFLALILIIIGALNWGLWGFFQFDIVAWLFKGNTNWMSRIAYAIIGLGGLWSLNFLSKCKEICSCCCKSESGKKGSGGGCCR
jgi:uncharacterized membrane protein YuzA (DUF378 family)